MGNAGWGCLIRFNLSTKLTRSPIKKSHRDAAHERKIGDIPDVVIDYVRGVFGDANREASLALTRHPAMHEVSLDHGGGNKSHWLGGRHMWGAWEIADIAVCVILRERGKLAVRKVALLQTKRLYYREIPVVEMERVDYLIGIGRIIDTTDPQIPLSQQWAFAF